MICVLHIVAFTSHLLLVIVTCTCIFWITEMCNSNVYDFFMQQSRHVATDHNCNILIFFPRLIYVASRRCLKHATLNKDTKKSATICISLLSIIIKTLICESNVKITLGTFSAVLLTPVRNGTCRHHNLINLTLLCTAKW